MNTFQFILNIFEKYAVFIQQLYIHDDDETTSEPETVDEPEPVADEPETTSELETVDESGQQGMYMEQTPVVQMECYHLNPPYNTKEFIQKCGERLSGSKIVVASIKQNGVYTYRTTEISMRKLVLDVAKTVAPRLDVKPYYLNHPASIKEIARCVFSKDDDTQIRLKLMDKNEKPYYVKMDNSE